MAHKILIIDDEASLREVLRIVLEQEGYDVREAGTGAEARERLSHEQFDLVVCDIFLPDANGLDLVRSFRSTLSRTRFVVITAHTTPANALAALREGAVEYLSKPFDVDELRLVVSKQLQAHRPDVEAAPEHQAFIGRSAKSRTLLDRIQQTAHNDATVLITGESGTGKELLARAIHAASPRGGRPFIPVNCGALPEGLLESELFGHVRGSFTGAIRDKVGMMQEASGGTLFLDEIAELPPNTQVKLLRALQERAVRPVGGNREIPVDIRVISATNQDLDRLTADGRVREDFYYRINVIHLHVPPLRERHEDIAALVRHFIEKTCARLSVPVKQVRPDAMAVLEAYAWPGNVRELENVIERIVALESSQLVTVSSLPANILGRPLEDTDTGAEIALPEDGLDLEAHLDVVRRELMRQALDRTGGVQKDAARLLRLSYRAFRYHAEKYKLIQED